MKKIILRTIRRSKKRYGISYPEIASKISVPVKTVEKLTLDLMHEGEIFEIRPQRWASLG